MPLLHHDALRDHAYLVDRGVRILAFVGVCDGDRGALRSSLSSAAQGRVIAFVLGDGAYGFAKYAWAVELCGLACARRSARPTASSDYCSATTGLRSETSMRERGVSCGRRRGGMPHEQVRQGQPVPAMRLSGSGDQVSRGRQVRTHDQQLRQRAPHASDVRRVRIPVVGGAAWRLLSLTSRAAQHPPLCVGQIHDPLNAMAIGLHQHPSRLVAQEAEYEAYKAKAFNDKTELTTAGALRMGGHLAEVVTVVLVQTLRRAESFMAAAALGFLGLPQ